MHACMAPTASCSWQAGSFLSVQANPSFPPCTCRAFQDRCPHRLAPLSEGILDAKSGELFCSYHGCECVCCRWTLSMAEQIL